MMFYRGTRQIKTIQENNDLLNNEVFLEKKLSD